MKIVKCTSGTIIIELDKEFSNITISAKGERINEGKDFCLSINSIAEEKPVYKQIDSGKQKRIARAIINWKDTPFKIEFYEEI